MSSDDWRSIRVEDVRFDTPDGEKDMVSSRVRRLLEYEGFKTMGEVSAYAASNPDWPMKTARNQSNMFSKKLGIANFGRRSWRVLREWLEKHDPEIFFNADHALSGHSKGKETI